MNILFEAVYHHPLLKPTELKVIAEAHQQLNFLKGHLFLKEGVIANHYFIIEKGLCRSFVNDVTGTEVTIDFFGEHQILIDTSSLFQRKPSQENLQALTDGVAWKIDFDTFQKLFHSIEAYREWGRGWMSAQLFRAKQRQVDGITISATKRYLQLLEENPQVIKEAPLKYIASYLGITDTSLSRIRKEIFES